MTIHPDSQYELARLRLEERLTRSLGAYEAQRARRPESVDDNVQVFSRRRVRALSWARELLTQRPGQPRTA
jgi:hypothetical protein